MVQPLGDVKKIAVRVVPRPGHMRRL